MKSIAAITLLFVVGGSLAGVVSESRTSLRAPRAERFEALEEVHGLSPEDTNTLLQLEDMRINKGTPEPVEGKNTPHRPEEGFAPYVTYYQCCRWQYYNEMKDCCRNITTYKSTEAKVHTDCYSATVNPCKTRQRHVTSDLQFRQRINAEEMVGADDDMDDGVEEEPVYDPVAPVMHFVH